MADTNGKLAEQGSRRSRITGRGKLFISYRRTDSGATAGRIRDWLVQRLPGQQVFFDVEDIEYGVDFERRIERTIPQCKAVLAIIGPRWLEPEGGPSLYIRFELELALRTGVPIIPVLVEEATMPTPEQLPPSLRTVANVKSAHVRLGHDFLHDMAELAGVLHIPLNPPITRSPRFWLLAAAVVALLALGTVSLFTIVPGLTSAARARTQATLVAGANNQTATAAIYSQTATAAASQAAATTTAAPYTYFAGAPGSCDTKGSWSQTPESTQGFSVSCQSSSALLSAAAGDPATGGGILALYFQGANGFMFPGQFTESADISNMQDSCGILAFTYQAGLSASNEELQVCTDGSWQAGSAPNGDLGTLGFQPAGVGSVTPATSYHLSIVSTGSAVKFSINSQVVATASFTLPAPFAMEIADADFNGPEGTLNAANFSVQLNS